MKINLWWGLAMAIGLAACGERGQATQGEGLVVESPWSRAVAPHAPVAAGYMTVRNGASVDDRLVEVRSEAAERVEIHEVRHEDGMARMRPLPEGVQVAAGATVEFKPGGYHLMFITPADGLFVAGHGVPATLVFEQAGEVTVEFEVRELGATQPEGGHEHH